MGTMAAWFGCLVMLQLLLFMSEEKIVKLNGLLQWIESAVVLQYLVLLVAFVGLDRKLQLLSSSASTSSAP